jgi:uncharacterized protein YcbK (DUF882 family)
MKHFTLEELVRSTTATATVIDNTPSQEVKDNLTALVDNVLDPLRARYNLPITVNSGYRCPKLNVLVGGALKSHHISGCAADITAGSQLSNMKIFELAQELELPFDQLIDEQDYKWVHISHRRDGKNRGQILHIP